MGELFIFTISLFVASDADFPFPGARRFLVKIRIFLLESGFI